MEKCEDSVSGMLCRSYPYASGDPAKDERVRVHGLTLSVTALMVAVETLKAYKSSISRLINGDDMDRGNFIDAAARKCPRRYFMAFLPAGLFPRRAVGVQGFAF